MDAKLLFQTYRSDMVSRRRSPRSLQQYDYLTSHSTRWLCSQSLDNRVEDIRRPDIQQYLADTGWAPATQKVAFAWVRAAFTYAVDEEYLDRNPCRRVRLAPIPEREPKTVAMAQLRELVRNCRSNADELFLRLFVYTGARCMEVRGLTWNDVSLAENTLLLHGKGDKDRLIPIHPKLRESLHHTPIRGPWVLTSQRGGPLTADGVAYRLGKLGTGVAPHDFRRTFATNLRQNGVDRAVIKTLIGHSRRSEGAWAAYDRVPMPEMQTAILRLFADDPV